jgi:L-glyceraldehyde 3-phosphate reductase
MAIAWVLRKPRVPSALIGVSRVEQLVDSLAALEKPSFAEEELQAIESTTSKRRCQGPRRFR